MKKEVLTYKQLHEAITKFPEKKYYVRTPWSYSPILASCKKQSETITLKFSNNIQLTIGDSHVFMNEDELPIEAKDLKIHSIIKTLEGFLTTISIKHNNLIEDVYDISIEAPHWYINSENNGNIIHHNTGIGLHIVKAFQDKYEESVVLFYDSEFGTPMSYFKSIGCQTENILHIPIHNIEELKFDIIKKLETIDRKDNIIIIVDSIGNLASKKEIDDAKDEKSVADMSRAKQLKSFFRMVTPYLQTKNIPMICIAHTYDTMDSFPKKVISGGTGILYSANQAFIIGRQQEKDGKETSGYTFVINAEKSRFVKEKSKFPLSISFEKGIDKYSGLLDLAIESGHVVKPVQGWYSKVDMETGEISDKKIREKNTHTKEFWNDILDCEKFKTFIKNKFSLNSILNQEE
jgi:RecA/RadA recombinase